MDSKIKYLMIGFSGKTRIQKGLGHVDLSLNNCDKCLGIESKISQHAESNEYMESCTSPNNLLAPFNLTLHDK